MLLTSREFAVTLAAETDGVLFDDSRNENGVETETIATYQGRNYEPGAANFEAFLVWVGDQQFQVLVRETTYRGGDTTTSTGREATGDPGTPSTLGPPRGG